MIRETLDDLIDSSAPAVLPDPGLREVDLRATVREARRASRPTNRRRRRATWIAVGSVLAATSVVGGVAVASTMMPHGFDDPWVNADYSHTFSLPSGRGCEMRLMVVDDEGGRDLSDAELRLSGWLASRDVWGLMDLDAARAQDAREAELHPGQTLLLDENGRLGDVQANPAERSPDDIYANVVSIAMTAAVDTAARATGVAPGEVVVWDSVRCDAVVG